MIEGDEWKAGNSVAPTPQDMVKFAAVRARLLVERAWEQPQEITVLDVAGGGEVFAFSNSYGGIFAMPSKQWARTCDVRIWAVLPSPKPPEPRQVGELTASQLQAAAEYLSKHQGESDSDEDEDESD